MKKRALFAAGLIAFGAATFTACKDDDDDDFSLDTEYGVAYSSDNATAWGNYMVAVTQLLKTDADNLYAYWNTAYENGDSYAKKFLAHDGNGTEFKSAVNCVEQIIDGCVDIASEVGSSKIGTPISLWNSGQKEEAVLSVESWFSWHSRVDYSNNIKSIRNAYYGTRTGSADVNSIHAAILAENPTLDAKVVAAIEAAIKAIENIPQPFRNNLASAEAALAQTACGALEDVLKDELKPYITEKLANYAWDPILEQYVNVVVLPTYKELSEKNTALLAAVKTFQASPSNANFAACGDAWEASRTPWETSEAFLFGPVADKGLDPNMDSWPLDIDGVESVLSSQNFNSMEWTGDFEGIDEENEDNSSEQAKKIAAAQNLRGFHTLEFLIFQNGKARTIN